MVDSPGDSLLLLILLLQDVRWLLRLRALRAFMVSEPHIRSLVVAAWLGFLFVADPSLKVVFVVVLVWRLVRRLLVRPRSSSKVVITSVPVRGLLVRLGSCVSTKIR